MSRLFSEAAGVGFNRTVTRLRHTVGCWLLAAGCRLPRGTDLPVSGICYRVGCTNLSDVTRHFRATTGMTPSRYCRIGEI